MAKKVIKQDGNEPKTNQISANTQIVFTVKSFFALIGTILGLFFGFYQFVVVPKVDKTEEHYNIMFQEQKEQNRIFYNELNKINSSIGSLNTSIETLNRTTTSTSHVANSRSSLGGSRNGSTAMSNN